MKKEELIKLVPKSYHQVNWQTYREILNNVMVDKPDNWQGEDEDFLYYQNLCTLSILLNIPYQELEALPFTTIAPLFKALSFLNKPVPEIGTKLKLKGFDEITYKDFQNLLNLVSNPWDNANDILEILMPEKSKEDIEKLSVYEVTQCFFQLTKLCKKSLTHSKNSLAWGIVKTYLKQRIQKMKNWFLTLMMMRISSSTNDMGI